MMGIGTHYARNMSAEQRIYEARMLTSRAACDSSKSVNACLICAQNVRVLKSANSNIPPRSACEACMSAERELSNERPKATRKPGKPVENALGFIAQTR